MSATQGRSDWKPGDSTGQKQRQLPDEYALILGDWFCEKCNGQGCTLCKYTGKVAVRVMRTADCSKGELEGGIADLEGLVVRVVKDYLYQSGGYLEPEERQDLITELMGIAWKEGLSYRYIGGTSSLKGFVYSRLKWRAIDWFRRAFFDERPLEKRLAKEGKSPAEIQAFILEMRKQRSLDADGADVKHAVTEDAQKIFEEGMRAREDLEALMTDGEVVYATDTIEDAERALGISAEALSPSAIWALVNIALPMANSESLRKIGEDTTLTRKQIEQALENLRIEIEDQDG